MFQRARWLPSELGLAGRENLDPAHVARYDGKMDADAGAEVALLAGHGLGADSTVTEFGPGAGPFTLAVARSGDGFESKYLLRAV